ncbi:MAG TPA: tetratricopeptide repeat protein [Terrimicrobiaceae bacterium]
MNCAGKLFFVCLFFVTVLCVHADTIQDGNAAFAKGDYPAAIRAFESALATQGSSAGLYYNLGISEHKNGQHAQAAVNLRRAIMLDPRMVDARMALSEIERSEGVPSARSTWRDFVAERAPLKVLLITGCVLAWLGAFLLLFAVFAMRCRLLPLLGAAGVVAGGIGIFLIGYVADPRVSERDAAVVLEKEGVTLLSLPADQSEVVLRLPSAASLRILRRSGEWTFCSAPGGERGWAPSKSLEPVLPSA